MSHRWKAFLKIEDDKYDRILRKYVDHVDFELHSTYAGNKIITKNIPPFEIERTAWGYFNLPIKIYFKDLIDSEPIVIDHMLCFDNNGITNNKIIKVKLKKEQTTMKVNKKEVVRKDNIPAFRI